MKEPIVPSKHLTDAFVRNVRVPAKGTGQAQVSYIDTMERGLALVLVVSYGGTKTFRGLTYSNGKPRSKKLGTYPTMSVKEARRLARAYWENPGKFAAEAEVGSFEEVALSWIKRHVEARGLRSKREIERQLAKYVYPRWKSSKFLAIRRREVNELLDYVADHHGRTQADAVLATLRSIMGWYQSRDENYQSPIVKGMRRSSPASRARILSDDEIRAVWSAADESGAFGALVKVLLLTAQRKAKVTHIRWDDISGGCWTIRMQRREKGSAGSLELPRLALDVLAAQPRIKGNPFVFPGRDGTAFNAFSLRKGELDEKLPGMPHWTLHDLRRTARSLMSRGGVRPDIAERVLGHAIPGVEGIYDRHHYSAEKAHALSTLARLIQDIVEPNVQEHKNRAAA
jgi:integrase